MAWDVLYVSPHADDVAFSAAAHVARDVARGSRVGLVTLFHAGAPGPFGDASLRHAEDARYAARAGVELIELGLPDALARDPRKRRFWHVLGPSAAEHPLVAEVVERLRALAAPTCRRIVGPLGLGNHVDHRIAHRALRALVAGGVDAEVACYEDTPYVLAGTFPSAVAFWYRSPLLARAPSGTRTLAAAGMAFLGRGDAREGTPETLRGVEEEKMAAVACYPSQWRQFYRSLEDWRRALRRYAASLGHTDVVERAWRMESTG